MDFKAGHYHALGGDSLASQMGAAVKILENRGSHCIVEDCYGFQWLQPARGIGEEVDPKEHFKDVFGIKPGFLP